MTHTVINSIRCLQTSCSCCPGLATGLWQEGDEQIDWRSEEICKSGIDTGGIKRVKDRAKPLDYRSLERKSRHSVKRGFISKRGVRGT